MTQPIIPVLWVSARPDIIARGYHDQGLLEELFARKLWVPPAGLLYDHRVLTTTDADKPPDFPDDIDGAVVLLPARHHVEQVEWFAEQLDRLKWAVVLLCGDEEWVFPWRDVPGFTMTVEDEPWISRRTFWYMQPIAAHGKFTMIPGGWYPRTREMLAEGGNRKRSVDWMFAGQVTHTRRELAWESFKHLSGGYKLATDGYLKGIKPADYFRLMAETKVIPCPSGPESVDTARTFEALEAGCIPVSDLLRPHGDQFDYWDLLFGEGNPLPKISDWSKFPEVLEEMLAGWPATANRCWSFWQQWKRKIAYQLDNDVRAMSGLPLERQTVDDQITVVMTTSPVHMHPSTEHIEITINSVREQLPNAEIIVVCDGVRPEDEGLRARYEQYQHDLMWLTNFRWQNVVPVRMDEWGHQANCVRKALELVTTPYVLMVEHDTPIKGDIPWEGFINSLTGGYANVIRLHHEASVLEDHEAMMLRPGDEGSTYRKTKAWWQRPHLASARFYRERVMPFFPESSRTFIEDVLYGKMLNDFIDHGDGAWYDWRVFVFTPDSGDMQHSWHLDSRGEHPKHSMRFS